MRQGVVGRVDGTHQQTCYTPCSTGTHHAPHSHWRLGPDLLRIVNLAMVASAYERDDLVLVQLRAVLDEVVGSRNAMRVRCVCVMLLMCARGMGMRSVCMVYFECVYWGTWGRCHGGRRDMGGLEQRAGARGGYGKRRADAVGVGGADERSRHDER